MSLNRRNHYRILHVQTDAPPEVIKAAYRALIALHHPDVGGDHELASLITEAHTVLSNATRRAAYDALRMVRWTRQPLDDSGVRPESARPRPPGSCPMCALQVTGLKIGRETRCSRCRAPMYPVRTSGSASSPAERRILPRVSKSDWAVLYPSWPSDVIDVRLRDLSLDGLSVYAGAEIPVGRTIRVTGSSFDVVADIVSCRALDRVFTLHARLVTALFKQPTGGFVSTSA